MKIDYEAKLTDLFGNALVDGDKELTLGDVLLVAALNAIPSDNNLTGKDKFDLYELAKKVKACYDLTVEEVAKLKERVGHIGNVTLVGAVYEKLEGGNDNNNN